MKRINVFSVKQVKERGGLYDLDSTIVNGPESAAQAIKTVLQLENHPVETFGIITLTIKNKIAGFHILSVGILNSTMVRPREVFIAALLNNAAKIVLFHNHPSGDLDISFEVVALTQQIIEAGKILGIEVLDHIIIGEDGHASVREAKIIEFSVSAT